MTKQKAIKFFNDYITNQRDPEDSSNIKDLYDKVIYESQGDTLVVQAFYDREVETHVFKNKKLLVYSRTEDGCLENQKGFKKLV